MLSTYSFFLGCDMYNEGLSLYTYVSLHEIIFSRLDIITLIFSPEIRSYKCQSLTFKIINTRLSLICVADIFCTNK